MQPEPMLAGGRRYPDGAPSPVPQDIGGMANKNHNPFLQYIPGYHQAQAAMQPQAMAMPDAQRQPTQMFEAASSSAPSPLMSPMATAASLPNPFMQYVQPLNRSTDPGAVLAEAQRDPNQLRDRIIHVPQIQYDDKVQEVVQKVEVPKVNYVIEQREVIKEIKKVEVRHIDRIVEVPQIVTVDKVIEVPTVQEVTKYKYVDVVVDVPVTRQVEVPQIQYKTIEEVRQIPVPQVVDVPVEHEVQVPVEVPQVQKIQRPYPVPEIIDVPVDVYIEEPVPYPVATEIPEYTDVIREVPRKVPVPVYQDLKVGVPVEQAENVPMMREVGVFTADKQQIESTRHIPTTGPLPMPTPGVARTAHGEPVWPPQFPYPNALAEPLTRQYPDMFETRPISQSGPLNPLPDWYRKSYYPPASGMPHSYPGPEPTAPAGAFPVAQRPSPPPGIGPSSGGPPAYPASPDASPQVNPR